MKMMKNSLAFAILILCLDTHIALADPFGGPVPGNEAPSPLVPSAPVGPPAVGAPEGQGPLMDAPAGNQPPPAQTPPGSSPYNPLSNGTNPSGYPANGAGQPGEGQGQNGPNATPQSNAPTFMNGALPNTQNPFLPTGVSPGTYAAPLTNLYELQGVPALAAPLMGQVFRPFGLSLYQPNPFQVVPQGMAYLSGSFETDTNIDFSPNNPQVGSLFTITPAVAYSTFDDYGYLSLLANASYDQYIGGNISSYLSETGGFSAGTYIGNRVFVGVDDFVTRGETPDNSGSPLQFLNGINPYLMNTMGAEAGFALTPKISFVQTATDTYFDESAFGAGISNIQSLQDTLNYIDKTTMLSASYIYSQGIFSFYPNFISNGVTGMAMHTVGHSSSAGVGGSYDYYMMQGEPLLNFDIESGYTLLNHTFNRNVTGSLEAGYNVVQFTSTGQSYPGPLLDANISYTSGHLSLAANAGWFEMDNVSYGIQTGPEDIKMAILSLTYQMTPRTTFSTSGGYSVAQIFNVSGFSNNFFQTPQLGPADQSYDYESIYITNSLSWRPNNWLMTSLIYNLIDFTTNLPNETVVDNQFIAMVSVYFPF